MNIHSEIKAMITKCKMNNVCPWYPRRMDLPSHDNNDE